MELDPPETENGEARVLLELLRAARLPSVRLAGEWCCFLRSLSGGWYRGHFKHDSDHANGRRLDPMLVSDVGTSGHAFGLW